MTNEYHKEKELISDSFEKLASGIISDPETEFEVEETKVIERETAAGSGTEIVFSVHVITNNRAQLLGQTYPFRSGGYSGHFNNIYSSKIIERIEREIEPNYRFFVQFNVWPRDDQNLGYVDQHLTLKQALEENILSEEDLLATKMKEYEMTSLILASGTVITGPLPRSFEVMEEICSRYEIESVLDLFTGTGAYARVAIEEGANHVDCLDKDITSAKRNLETVKDRVEFHEKDALQFETSRDYDLVIADPYYDLADEYLEKKGFQHAASGDLFYMTIASVGEDYWEERITDMVSEKFSLIEKFNTGRTIKGLFRT